MVCHYCNCFDDWDYSYEVQSSDVIVKPPGDGADEKVQTTVFSDEEAGLHEEIDFYSDPMSELGEQNVADLKDFLGRPVRIDTFTWNETDGPDTALKTINPWFLFFNESRIKNKLTNFAFIRCRLHIKILVNASPFYYGCMGVTYQPLQNFTPSTVYSTGQQALMPYSQRPIVWLYPQESQGAEMTLPFFNHRNWLDIDKAAAFTNMGELRYYPFTLLQSANGVVGQGVTIQTYAWAEEVHLSGATLSFALQSTDFKVKDEYGLGPVSAPASAVAKLAGQVKKWQLPYITKFATATQIGADAISGIAKIFGYTNVPIIEDIKPLRPSPFPMLASPEISFPVEKLTLDPKNELSIDPTIVGAPAEDPLAIANLIKRESFETRFDWTTTAAVDDLLYVSRVSPYRFRASGNTANSVVDFTPMGMVARLFDSWRGDIIFRFKIVASPYHKGRLMVSFDPQGTAASNIVATANTTSAVYSAVVDLGESRDVEFRVPYVQATAFLQTSLSTAVSNQPYQTSGFAYNTVDDVDNGTLTVRVLTRLTAPVATAPVSILCFTRGAEEMEFANPRNGDTELTNYAVQSLDFTLEGQSNHSMGKPTPEVDPRQFTVNFGEVVKSLRVLLHRANYVYSQADPLANGTMPTSMKSVFGKLPPYRGYDLNGIHTAAPTIGVGTKPYNFVHDSVVQWILPAFIGYRGSGVWTFNCNNAAAMASVTITRDPAGPMVWSDTTGTGYVVATKSGASSYFSAQRQRTQAGTALTNQLTQAGLSVLCPNYNYMRFNSTAPTNTTVAPVASSYNTYDGSDKDTFDFELFGANANSNAVRVSGVVVDKYWSAGPDFQPLFFLNVPSHFKQLTSPTPV